MERPVAEHGSKTREERQNYLPSNTHLEGLQGSFNGKWQGFSMVCSESEIRLVELFKFSWLNKISLKGQIGPTCMGPLASEITFAN